ncbi:uncharacterized protein LOC106088310 [Stomoxys calcitrans]|uniref:uncharacterized protein LOC106088310 n=1 Tax=Stomoxys calcitrans TaxID=35570 RepID=UPI0027E2C321|nr:uncharacterized protein LOC106088310 [Stomoxys calcitrans]
MLKWTASASKNPQDTPITQRVAAASSTNARTPRLTTEKRRKRRATIANKENIPIVTSTPMVNRTRNSPLVLAPFADILNVTPEAPGTTRTPERRRVSIQAVPVANTNPTTTTRRHSSVGFTIPTAVPQYATTLPKFEEEYSPNNLLPTGQQLALRGLLPDPFMGNRRYFATPEMAEQEVKKISSLPKKRKLEMDFIAIAQEEGVAAPKEEKTKKDLNQTGVVSNRMGDQTLDKLIDAILDSACKDEKKKKPRKSFNLRRRTLLKNQVDTVNDLMLSPSYAAGDDPCSDLSFLGIDPEANVAKKPFKALTPKAASPIVQVTPHPATPNPGTPMTTQQLLHLPTPKVKQDSFNLATPVRPNLKRRSDSKSCQNSSAKKYKVDSRNYFEIGLALPSIYV